MTSISLRGNDVPAKVILLRDDSSTPAGYTSITSYNGKYLRQVPTAATNPGSAVGATTHTHASAGSHGHTPDSGAHTHGGSTGGPSITGPRGTTAGPDSTAANSDHTHSFTSGSESPTVTIGGGVGAHTHAVKNNDPLFRTYRLINPRSRLVVSKSIKISPKCLIPLSTIMFGA